MYVYYVSSVDAAGVTITTRHFTHLGVEQEKLRRFLAGHLGVGVQLGVEATDEERCVQRKQAWQRRPRPGGSHV